MLANRTLSLTIALGAFALLPAHLGAQSQIRPWYERYGLRGYVQLRYNRLLETNPRLGCQACDRSLGANNGFSLRRARLVLSGDPSTRSSLLVEVDYSSDIGGQTNVLQLRTFYVDLFLDRDRSQRLRLGQPKLPYGFETLQSSSQRPVLDRSDAINSGVPNERDMGVFYLWTPAAARTLFRYLSDSGLKGSGDHGVLALGIYNGQSANRPEANDNLHVVARIAYPFRLRGRQAMEVGVQGYSGRFVVPQRSASVAGPSEFQDRRLAWTFVVYPQPLGVQAEWNVGRGPEFDPSARRIDERPLRGGYLLLTFRPRDPVLVPFLRQQWYRGGKKLELDARRYRMHETEVGTEWYVAPNVKITAQYTISDRRYEDGANPDNRQRGRMLRLQAQVSY
jgi:hypothetical protein